MRKTRLTDIVNNLTSGIYGNGIEVHLASESGVADANSYILIENNTCSESTLGIIVYGVTNESSAGHVMVADNVFTYMETYGLCFFDIMRAGIYNTGYYLNGHKNVDHPSDPNWYGGHKWPDDVNLPQENPVIISDIEDYPFVVDSDGNSRCSLRQDCAFIDAGSRYIEDTTLIGRTTDINGIPDSNVLDIGFHHSVYGLWWYYMNAGEGVAAGDINKDAATDWPDLQLLAHNWLDSEPNDANDINDDGIVNLKDFAILAQTWFKIQGHPNIRPMVSGDVNNLSGNVDVNIVNFGPGAWRAFVLMDGQFMGEIWDFAQGYSSLLETPALRNGEHNIKAVTVDYSGDVTVSPILTVDCNNLIHAVVASEYFHPSESYKYNGFCRSTCNLTANLTDSAGQSLWSNTYTDPNISITIPGSSFGDEQLCKLSLTDGAAATKKIMAKKFDTAGAAGKRMAIILPNADVSNKREVAIDECIKTCDFLGVTHVVLRNFQVTEENLRSIFNNPNVKYIYWCGHANSHIGPVQRTHTECWVRFDWADTPSTYLKCGAFSYTRNTVPEAPVLPDDWDNRGFDLWSLGMWDSWNKKIVFVDGCLSAEFEDMAAAYGVFSLEGLGSKDQIYIGWRQKVLVSSWWLPDTIVGDTTEGVRMFWERMGYSYSVKQALEYTSSHGSAAMQQALWGYTNPLPQLGDESGDDNIFVRGLGFTNLNTIELEP